MNVTPVAWVAIAAFSFAAWALAIIAAVDVFRAVRTVTARYVVTELRGYLDAEFSRRRAGVSFMVQDTLGARRTMATFRSEDYVTPNMTAEDNARRRADARCMMLNYRAELAREAVSPASGMAS